MERKRHDEADEDDTRQHDSAVWREIQDKLTTKEDRKTYASRKVIVEPVFGHAKEARRFRRFSLRGLNKVQTS